MSELATAASFRRVSHIAAALAKSKGKAVTPPPESAVVPSTPGLGVSTPPVLIEAAPAKKSRLRVIVALAAIAVAAVIAIAWWTLRPTPPSDAAAPPTTRPVAAAVVPAPGPDRTAAVAANKQDQAAIAQALSTPKPAPAPAPTPSATPELTASDFFETVKKFSIAAVKEGPHGRAMIDGKTHAIGAEIVPGLWLREIGGGRLIFRDAQGNEFVRRF